MVAELDDLGDLMELCAGQVDPANCGALAACLSTHARDAVVSSRLAKVLEAVGRDDAVADLLCDVCGLEHLILGLEKASAPDHVLHVVALLDRASLIWRRCARLGTKQYITILNQVCLGHMAAGRSSNTYFHLRQAVHGGGGGGHPDGGERALHAQVGAADPLRRETPL